MTDLDLDALREETAAALTDDERHEIGYGDGLAARPFDPPAGDRRQRQAYTRGYARGLIHRTADGMTPPPEESPCLTR